MKNLSIIISAILILVNVLAGIILKDYMKENIIMSSCVILLNAILLLIVANSKMKDAFKVSYHLLFPVFCIIEFILAIIAPNTWENNYYLVSIIGFIAFQAILLFAAIIVTQHNMQYD
jgi:hypothetical protein